MVAAGWLEHPVQRGHGDIDKNDLERSAARCILCSQARLPRLLVGHGRCDHPLGPINIQSRPSISRLTKLAHQQVAGLQGHGRRPDSGRHGGQIDAKDAHAAILPRQQLPVPAAVLAAGPPRVPLCS